MTMKCNKPHSWCVKGPLSCPHAENHEPDHCHVACGPYGEKCVAVEKAKKNGNGKK